MISAARASVMYVVMASLSLRDKEYSWPLGGEEINRAIIWLILWKLRGSGFAENLGDIRGVLGFGWSGECREHRVKARRGTRGTSTRRTRAVCNLLIKKKGNLIRMIPQGS